MAGGAAVFILNYFLYSGVEQWQLAGPITLRFPVRVRAPQPFFAKAPNGRPNGMLKEIGKEWFRAGTEAVKRGRL